MEINKCLNFKQIMLVTALLALSCIFLTSCAEKEEKVYRVGILSALDLFADTTDGFIDKMTELGYIEGENIVYDLYETNVPVGNEETLKKFVDDKVDLIFACPTEATLEAKSVSQGSGIPIVFANGGIEGTNLVESITQPGGNLTGVRFPSIEVSLKRLELIGHLVYIPL